MAHNLKLSVVAEGVETEAQRAFLKAHRCDEFQGFLVSPPVEASEFARLLERPRWRRALGVESISAASPASDECDDVAHRDRTPV
jgi:sensor c-di-GMP phosphodiesterase-like protein